MSKEKSKLPAPKKGSVKDTVVEPKVLRQKVVTITVKEFDNNSISTQLHSSGGISKYEIIGLLEQQSFFLKESMLPKK